MKVSTRLKIGFATMFVLLALTIPYAVNIMDNQRQNVVSVEEDIIPNIMKITEIEKAADESYQQTTQYLFYDSFKAKNTALAEMKNLEELSQNYLSTTETTNTTEFSEKQSLVTLTNTLIANLTEITNLKDNGTSYEQLYTYHDTVNLPLFLRIQGMINEKKNDSLALLSAIGDDNNKAYISGLHLLLTSAALILIVGIITAYLTTRSITRPLKALIKGTEMISQGNLKYRVGTTSNDEIGELSRAFDKMALSLDVSMTSIGVLNKEIADRKKVEKAVEKSVEKFRFLFEYAKDAIFLADAETGTIIDVNPAGSRLIGLPKEQLIGIHQSELHPKETGEKYKKMFQKHIQTSGTTLTDILVQRADGTQVPVDISANLIELDGKPILQGVFHDVTERKKAEEALRKSQEFNDSLLNNAPHQLMVLNPDTSIRYINPEFEKVNGWTLDEVIGQKAPHPWWTDEIRNEKGIKALQEMIMMDSGKGESIARKKNGELYWLEVNWVAVKHKGELQYCLLNSVDITERKKREKRQQDENHVLTLLGQGAELGEILEAIIHLGEEHDPNIKGSILLYDPEKHRLNFSTGPNIPAGYRERMKNGISVSDNAGVCGTAAYRKERIIVPDIANSEYFQSYPTLIEAGAKDNLMACWSQPILASNGDLLGTITNYSNQVGEPDTGHLEILEWSTRIAGVAIERRQAEEALQESEKKFYKAFRSSPTTVVITSLNDGKFIEVNDSFYEITGYTREEVIGRNVKELDIWADVKDRNKMLKVLKRDGRVRHHEYNFRRKSGEIRIWAFSGELIDIGREPCIISLTTDITEYKRVENAMKESEEKFSKAFHASPAAISLSLLDDGTFIEVNDAYVRLLGYSRKELIGRTAENFNILARDDQKEEMLKNLKNRVKLSNKEYEYRIKSGEIRTILVSSEFLTLNGKECALVTSNDTTESKRMIEALRESEEKFNKAFQASPDIAAIISRDDHKYIEVNKNFLDFLGHSRDEVIGHTPTEIGLWADDKERERMVKIILKQENLHNEEFRMRTKSGEIRIGLQSSENINIGGKPCSITMIVDITERKRMEEKLKQTLTELEESSAQLTATNKELETFSYSVSHDLRSPLRSIDGFSQALLEDYQEILDDTGKDYLQRLRNASQKMGELIDGILKLSRLTRNEMHKEEIDLSGLVEEISTRLQEDEPKRHAQFIIKKGLVTQGDPQMVRALMENLVGNAWKFTKNREEAQIEFGTEKNGAKTTYYINDNGVGFDMTYADKLFGAFQRLHDASEFPGTGIGLATVQRIINRHGGNIWAEGAVDKGATFYFTLN
jgi:PAS domain S-box-containing protein